MPESGDLPLLRPRALPAGSCIGVCAPSGPVTEPLVFEAMLTWWREQGYELRCAEHVSGRRGYLSAEDDQRQQDFEALLDDPDVHGIVFARGGYGVARWLRGLDPQRLRAARKLLIGYSDATLLLLVSAQHARVAALHGPMLERDDLSSEACSRMLALIRGEHEGLQPLQGKSGAAGRVQAPLVGGNLTLLASSLGTPWEVDTRGAILFIEERAVQPYALDRLLVQLRESGKLAELAGAAVGQLVECESERYPEVSSCEAVHRLLLESVDGPIVLDLPVGHVADHRALGMGVKAELDGDRGTLAMLEPVVDTTIGTAIETDPEDVH